MGLQRVLLFGGAALVLVGVLWLVPSARRAISSGVESNAPRIERDEETLRTTFAQSTSGREASGPAPQSTEDRDRSRDLHVLLARLRMLTGIDTFHVDAWPVIGELAGVLAGDPRDEGALARLVAVSEGREGDPPDVRGATLLALAAAGRSDAALPLADRLRASADHELERAAWIAIGLCSTGRPGLKVSLADYRGGKSLRTYPAAFDKEPEETRLTQAFGGRVKRCGNVIRRRTGISWT